MNDEEEKSEYVAMPCWMIKELELLTGIPNDCEGDDCCPDDA